MDVKGKKVVIIGAGKSGVSAAVLLKKAGAEPVIYDGNEKLDIQGTKDKIDERLDAADKGGVRVVIGEPDEKEREDAFALCLSPGVPVDTELVERFKEKNIPVVVSTRINRGTIMPEQLLVPGTIAAYDLPPAKAAVLLRLALTTTTDPAEIQEMFSF